MKPSTLIAFGLVSILPLCFAAETPRRNGSPVYRVIELPAPAGADFRARKINNQGDVLGHIDFDEGEFDGEAHAALYSAGTTTDLHLLVPGHETNRTRLSIDLNDLGQAIFYTLGGSPGDQLFLYDQGQLVDLKAALGRNDIDILALNNAGTLVGATIVENDVGEAFLYAHGQLQMLGLLPGLPNSLAYAINNRGRIIGWAGDSPDDESGRSVVFSPRGVIPLPLQRGYAIAINDRGDILGNSFLRRRGGRIVRLPFVPAGFNNRGHVVGSSVVNGLDSNAMLFSRGKAHDLNDLIDPASGWNLLHAHDINDRGQIVGWGRLNDHWAGFLLTPTR